MCSVCEIYLACPAEQVSASIEGDTPAATTPNIYGAAAPPRAAAAVRSPKPNQDRSRGPITVAKMVRPHLGTNHHAAGRFPSPHDGGVGRGKGRRGSN